MRLIDADELMKKIREVDFVADVDLMKITHDSMLTGFFHGSVQGIVDRLPTAYDLDKVVEQLEKVVTDEADLFATEEINYDSKGNLIIRSTTDLHSYALRCLDKAIEIVKGGMVCDS